MAGGIWIGSSSGSGAFAEAADAEVGSLVGLAGSGGRDEVGGSMVTLQLARPGVVLAIVAANHGPRKRCRPRRAMALLPERGQAITPPPSAARNGSAGWRRKGQPLGVRRQTSETVAAPASRRHRCT